VIYASIYRHLQSIPTAVGANLVPAERLLKGEVPYRDFYKIQTPGILLINAAVFRLFETTLLTAMTLVLVFKVLTIGAVFACARKVSDWKLALMSSALSLVWLAPGGPFRSAPVQYEMLFIVSAVWFTLRWIWDRRRADIFLAGLAVGVVGVFKQNVGVYASLALAGSVMLSGGGSTRLPDDSPRIIGDLIKTNIRALCVGALGVALPVAAMFIYLASQNALRAAIKVFVSGPAEHLQTRFTGYPIPGFAALIVAATVLALLVARNLVGKYPRQRALIIALLLTCAAAGAVAVPRAAVDNSIYWFAPVLFALAIWGYFRAGSAASGAFEGGDIDKPVVLALLLFAMAAYGEVFPRSVRGLVIDTMPPAFILLAFLFRRVNSDSSKPDREEPGAIAPLDLRRAAAATVFLVMFLFAVRTVGPVYYSIGDGRGVRMTADTELDFERGRGVYLPADRAREVNAVVEFIQSRVQPGEYIFAHSLDATSYYFLAVRNSPTTATLWNDTGTNDTERARIIDALREKQVRLVLTSSNALEVERYGPLLDLLRTEYHETATIGHTILLERN
jgi:hypothetical protein